MKSDRGHRISFRIHTIPSMVKEKLQAIAVNKKKLFFKYNASNCHRRRLVFIRSC